MVRILPIKEFAVRKKILLAQSNLQRHTALLQIAAAKHSLDEYKRKFAIVGISSLAFSAALSISGFLFARKKSAGGKGGLIAKIFSGISFFNQIKGVFSRLKSAGDGPA